MDQDVINDYLARLEVAPGNAVPPAAAEAIASVMGRTLLLAWAGESFMLSNEPIWVRPITVAAAVDLGSRGPGRNPYRTPPGASDFR